MTWMRVSTLCAPCMPKRTSSLLVSAAPKDMSLLRRMNPLPKKKKTDTDAVPPPPEVALPPDFAAAAQAAPVAEPVPQAESIQDVEAKLAKAEVKLEKAKTELKEAKTELEKAEEKLKKAEEKLEKANANGDATQIAHAVEDVSRIRAEVKAASAMVVSLGHQIAHLRDPTGAFIVCGLT